MSLSLLTLLFLILLLNARQVLDARATTMSATVVQHFRAAVNVIAALQLPETGIANWSPGSRIACVPYSVGGPSDDNQLPVNGFTRCAVVEALRFVPWSFPGQRQSF